MGTNPPSGNGAEPGSNGRASSRSQDLRALGDMRVARVGNEFASVEVSIDRSGRNPRLLLRDVVSGQARLIDPLVLEALVFMDDDQMQRLADPNLIISD